MLALVGATITWILARLDWQEFRHRLADASSGYLALMLAVWLIVLLVRPVRFRFLINVFDRGGRAPYAPIWSAMMIAGAVNSLVPMRAGDALIVVFMRQRLGIGVQRTFSVIATDWACDFLCVAAAFVGALAFAPAVAAWTQHVVTVLAVVVALAVVGAAAVLYHRAFVLTILDRVLGRLTPRWQKRGLEMAEELLASFATIATWKVAVPLSLISALIWMLTGLSYWLGLRAFALDPPAAAAIFNMAAVTLSFAVPLGPGGMGAFEASSVLALSVFDVPLAAAIAFAIVAHVCQLGSILLFAAISALTHPVHLQSLRRDYEKP